MPESRSVSVFLRAFTSQYTAAMTKATASMKGFGAAAGRAGPTMTKVGTSMSRVGGTLTRNVTLPIAALGAASIKTAIDFESAFTGVRKTIDATEQQYRELETGIKRMAERIPASVEEISAVAEAAGQLGVKREAILSFTETMIGLGETTNLVADQAATWGARFANIVKMPQKNFSNLGATLVDLGNKGASTEAEIAEMSLRIAGAGAQVGMSEAQILGFAEALSSVGINAEAGGSAISRVFIEMANAVAGGGEELSNFAKIAGTSSADFKRQFEDDAAGATIEFIEGLARVKRAGGNVFQTLEDLGLSEIRVRDALLRAAGAGKLFARSQETANAAWEENNAHTREAAKRYATNEAKLKMLAGELRNVAAKFGEDLIPILKDGMKVLSDLAQTFSDMDPAMRKNIIRWGAMAIALGPVVRLLGGVMQLGGGAASILGKLGAGAATSTVPAAAGAAGMGAGAVGASILASAGLAHLADTGIEALGKKLVPEGEGLGHEVGRAIVQGLRVGLGNVPGIGLFFKNHDAAADLLADTRTEAEKLADAFTHSTAANRKFLNVAGRAKDITAEQAAKIAILIDNAERFTGGLNDLQVQQVGNLLAMGDFKAAMDLIRGAMDDATGKTKRLGDGFRDAGADADEAALKADHFKRSLDAIPSQKTVRITVYQDTVSQEIIRKTRETGSGKLPLDSITPRVMTSYSGSSGGVTINVDARGSSMSPSQVEQAVRKGIDASGMSQGRMERARTARVA